MSTEVTKHNDQTAMHFWRADITGLRALAVIPVILYHAFPMLAPGGYVGVDIFFVISGFLISGIIFRQLKSRGNVCYGDFWNFTHIGTVYIEHWDTPFLKHWDSPLRRRAS